MMSHEDTSLVAMKMCLLGYVGILDFSGYTEKYIEAAHWTAKHRKLTAGSPLPPTPLIRILPTGS